MRKVSSLAFAGLHSLALAAATATSAKSYSYQNFQAIGFGIYTGSAPAILGINETCVQETRGGGQNDPRCTSGLTIDDPFSQRKLCLECLIFNPECQCNIDDMVCHQQTGVLDSFEASCYLGKENINQDVIGRVAIWKLPSKELFK